ncbi:MAG: ABC transporter permease subunit [Candidatus Delongbacteria bacterium]|nr:ABC transporter permease subunit [Candidatus Delongbacteria bacterium]MBN2836235.1 ABC transporter permease subunit [Candidatus Delongbacteria bacterium]
MFKSLIIKEIKQNFVSRKSIPALFLFILLYLIIFSFRVIDFDKRSESYHQDVALLQEKLQQSQNYSALFIPVVRKPVLFSIFHEGKTHETGNVIYAKYLIPIISPEFESSESNLLYRVNHNLDITYLITFLISLLMLITTYDSISAEKENGTLRLLVTYGLKRPVILFAKIAGNFMFGSLVFIAPFALSVIYLIIFKSDYIDSEFVFTMLFYLIATLLFIMIMTVIGVSISVFMKKESRSLVTALALWILISLVIPSTYLVVGKQLIDNDSILNIKEKYKALATERDNFGSTVPDSINPGLYGHWNWNGSNDNFHDNSVLSTKGTVDAHIGYNKLYYNTFRDKISIEEDYADMIAALNNRPERLKPYLLFFNPVSMYESLMTKLTDTSFDSQIDFLSQVRSLKISWLDTGLKEGWLFDHAFFSSFSPEYYIDYDEIQNAFKIESPKEYEILVNRGENEELSPDVRNNWFRFMSAYVDKRVSGDYKNSFKVPENMPVYKHNQRGMIEIITDLSIPMTVTVIFGMIILIITAIKFKKFDVR